MAKNPKIGDLVASWATELVVPGTPDTPFYIPPAYRRWLNRAFSPRITESYLSVARKNIKTATVGLTLLAFLLGKVPRPSHWRAICASISSKNIGELKGQMQAIATVNNLAGLKFYATPQPGHILGPDNTVVDFLSADKASGHSSNAATIVFDELGLLDPNKADLVDNLLGALAAQRHGKFLAISVQGHSAAMASAKARKDDPGVNFLEFVPSDSRCTLDDPKAWREANPTLGKVKQRSFMKAQAAAALADPSKEPGYRTFHLNLPSVGADREMILSTSDFLLCCHKVLPERTGPCLAGYDAGESEAMTAACFYWPVSGRLECYASFPTQPALEVRAKADSVGDRYERMLREGNLVLTGGRTTSYEQFLRWCLDKIGHYEIAGLACDRVRKADTSDAFEAVGIDLNEVNWRATGPYDAAEDIRAFKRAFLTQRVHVLRSLLLESAILESKVSRNTHGNPVLDRARRRGRIDVLQAALMAVGLGERVAAMWELRGEAA